MPADSERNTSSLIPFPVWGSAARGSAFQRRRLCDEVSLCSLSSAAEQLNSRSGAPLPASGPGSRSSTASRAKGEREVWATLLHFQIIRMMWHFIYDLSDAA